MLELKDLQIEKTYINIEKQTCKVIRITEDLVTLIMSNNSDHWDKSKWLSVIKYGDNYPQESSNILFNNRSEINNYLKKINKPIKLNCLLSNLNYFYESLHDLRETLTKYKNKCEKLKLLIEREFKEGELNNLIPINNLKIGKEYLEYNSSKETFKKILVDFIYFIDNKNYIVNTSIAKLGTYYLYFEDFENINSAKTYIDLDYAKTYIYGYKRYIKDYTNHIIKTELEIEKLKLEIKNLKKETL